MESMMDGVLALDDITVLELADIRGEFLGKLLASLGARVIKVEPPAGTPTRRYGPFYEDTPHPERSLAHWHYNQGKQGVTLNIETRDGRELLKHLARKADVLVETGRPGFMTGRGLGYEALHKDNPALVMLSITDFGQTGPHKDLKGSDLVFLALGGQMMISGYPPGPDGKYDTPPIAPQMWQSSHIAGSMGCFDLLAALWHRRMTGRGQFIDYSMHAAANSCTENWLARYLTDGFISQRRPTFDGDALSRDGYNMVISNALFPEEWDREAAMLAEAGVAEDLTDPQYKNPAYRNQRQAHITEVRRAFLRQRGADEAFLFAQQRGAIWAPVRPPEGSLNDPHFTARGAFAEVEHSELGKRFTYAGAPWVAKRMPWKNGTRAPMLGEHNREVYGGMLNLTREDLTALAQAGVI